MKKFYRNEEIEQIAEERLAELEQTLGGLSGPTHPVRGPHHDIREPGP